MTRICILGAALCGLLFAPRASAQAVAIKWQLNNTTQLTASSTSPAWATGNSQIVSGGPAPVVQVFDYWLGNAPPSQRLWSGTSGWMAGTENSTRFIQFDAAPAAGQQLAVTSVSFNYGGAGVNGHVRANVYYSTNNWITRTLLSSGPLAYPSQAMLSFAKTFAAPAVSGAGRFSLRIYPYAVLSSIAVSPTFATHNNVVINGTRASNGIAVAQFYITKTTGAIQIPGTYTFTLTCNGPGGPYSGTAVIVLPGAGVTSVTVPAGDQCLIAEAVPSGSSWNSPVFTGSGVGPVATANTGWSAIVGPITASGGSFKVMNSRKR